MKTDYMELIPKALTGDKESLQALYQHTHHKVYYTSLSILKNEHDALDAVQETYIKAFRSLKQLKNHELFEKWIVQIAANTCKDMLRKKKPDLLRSVAEPDSFIENTAELDRDFIPAEYVDDSVKRAQIMELIHALPAEQETTLLLYFYDDFSVKEIAEIMEVGESTVTSRLAYGKKQIKKGIESLEKKGEKFFTFLPVTILAKFFLQDSGTHAISESVSTELVANITAVIGGAAGGAVGVGAGAAKSSSGFFAKLAALSAKAKAAIGIAAATVAAGAIAVGMQTPPIPAPSMPPPPTPAVILWQDRTLGALVGEMLSIPPEEVTVDDVKTITELYIQQDKATLTGSYFQESESNVEPFSGEVESLQDIRHFSSLDSLEVAGQRRLDLSTVPEDASFSLALWDNHYVNSIDITQAQNLVQLHYLSTEEDISIGDYSFVTKMPQLQMLETRKDSFTSTIPFTDLFSLETLVLMEMEEVDMSVVGSIPKLRVLRIEPNRVLEEGFVSYLKNAIDYSYLSQLETVEILHIPISDDSMLYASQMPNIKRLVLIPSHSYIDGQGYVDAPNLTAVHTQQLANLEKLEHLEVNGSQRLKDASLFASLKQVKTMRIAVTESFDFSALRGMESLETLQLMHYNSLEQSLEMIEEALPNVEIIIE